MIERERLERLDNISGFTLSFPYKVDDNMIEYLIAEQSFFAFSGFLVAEIFYRKNARVLLTFQNLKNVKNNLIKISKKINQKKSSAIVISLGKRTINLHHSRLGWVLAGISVIVSSISLLSVSLGIIFHHMIKERKIF